MRHNLKTIFCSLVLSCFMIPSVAQAQFSIELDLPDFGVTDVFGQLTTLDLNVDVAGPLVAGAVYSDPVLNGVVYDVFGLLDEDSVPSGFPAFNLSRTIGGAEFFSQGSSLNFEVSSTADVSDGLQISELVADANGLIFEFDGREVGTGRFHPPLIQLFADGTGTIQNSNNTGGINPVNGLLVDVGFGDEFSAGLSFSQDLTLATAVPEPSSMCLLMAIGSVVLLRRRSLTC